MLLLTLSYIFTRNNKNRKGRSNTNQKNNNWYYIFSRKKENIGKSLENNKQKSNNKEREWYKDLNKDNFIPFFQGNFHMVSNRIISIRIEKLIIGEKFLTSFDIEIKIIF